MSTGMDVEEVFKKSRVQQLLTPPRAAWRAQDILTDLKDLWEGQPGTQLQDITPAPAACLLKGHITPEETHQDLRCHSNPTNVHGWFSSQRARLYFHTHTQCSPGFVAWRTHHPPPHCWFMARAQNPHRLCWQLQFSLSSACK